jgi:hypothetical protein
MLTVRPQRRTGTRPPEPEPQPQPPRPPPPPPRQPAPPRQPFAEATGALIEAPDDAQVQEFRAQVRLWMEMDGAIDKLQAALKDRRAYKKQLTERILRFMARFNIEDLAAKDCVLRYKVSYVRSPLSHRVIQQRLQGYYANDPVAAETVTQSVFNRERVERVSLRKLKIT